MASTAASKFIRSGNTPIRHLIHRHLQPTVTATASATTQHGTAAVYNWNYLFPHTFGPPLESKSNNLAVSKLYSGNQLGLCGFSVLDDLSRVQARAQVKEVGTKSDPDDDDSDIDSHSGDDDDFFSDGSSFDDDDQFDAEDVFEECTS